MLKYTVNYFKEQNVPVRTIYNIVAKYRKHNLTSYLPKSDRRKNISDQQLQTLVKLVNNKVGVSQRHLARLFGVSQSTVSRHLNKRTSVRIYKRKSAPKYNNEDQ